MQFSPRMTTPPTETGSADCIAPGQGAPGAGRQGQTQRCGGRSSLDAHKPQTGVNQWLLLGLGILLPAPPLIVKLSVSDAVASAKLGDGTPLVHLALD